MMQLLHKKRLIIFSLIIILLGLFLFINQVKAEALNVGLEYATATGLGTQDIRVTIANIIRVFLGLLGVVAVALIIYGGYLYMTAEGVPEKIERAKKLLISALIGLVIILSAFAIASFVLSRLVAGTGGVVPQAVCGNGVCESGENYTNCPADCLPPSPPPPPPPAYCSDPNDDTAPWLCLDPNSGLRDAGITVTAGNIGTTPGKIYFRDKDGKQFPAEILKCNENDPDWFAPIPNSDLSRAVIKVPQTLTLAGNDYNVVAETATPGVPSTFDKDWGISERQDIFKLTGESLSDDPILICLVDQDDNEVYSAKANDVRKLKGQRFGNVSGTVTYNNVIAPITGWGVNNANTTVPLASSGFVKLKTSANNISNGLWTDIYCETGADCLTGCCLNNSCRDSQFCLPWIGETCADEPACTDAGCYPDLVCDLNSCTCQQRVLPGPGEGCDANPGEAGCQLGQCNEGLYCSTAENCTCQYLPQIDDVIPDNGAPGNYVTLIGHGFGTTLGQVIFLGDEDDSNDDKQAILPTGCGAANIWQDNQVIIEIPEGAADGPLKLINADNLNDTTSDNDGAVLDFDVNTTTRPSICNLNPNQGEFGQSVTISGKNFGEVIGQALIGGLPFDNKASWSWLDTEINNLLVPNIEPATLPVQVQTTDAAGNPLNSNPYNFEVLPSATAPKINYIDPGFGPTGQYVTIFGINFGNEAGIVRFLNVAGETDSSKWLPADTNFSQDCSNAFWHNNYIVVKVPNGALADSKIVVETNDNLFSNTVDFNHCNQDPNTCPLRPGICRISPDQGPIGTTDVTLYGENFGSYLAGQSQVSFWQNKDAGDLATYWTDNRVGSGQIDNGFPLIVPAGAETGPVQLVDQFGIKSNQIQFEVKDCRDDPTICAPGLICCPKDGVCKLESQCAAAAVSLCKYSWSFTTGEVSDLLTPPQVVEDILCNDNTQSPTPWKDSTDNCVNIWISARFTKPMNTTTLNASNILVQNCGTAGGFDENNCTPQLVTASEIDAIDDIGFIFKPAQDLATNTWYKVTLKSGDNGIKSALPQNLQLDGDFDTFEGGDYSWSFRTRSSAQACDIDKVVVNPQEATIETLSKTQEYNAFALANNCNILNSDAYNWNWYKVYSDGYQEAAGALDTNYGVALVSEEDVLPAIGGVIGNGNVDYKQTATPTKQGLTYVAAAASDKKDDNNRLVVDLNIPEIDRIYPDNGLIHPDVNSYVTIFGKNFGDNSNGSQVLFEDVPASLADCPNVWTDTAIQVKVPKAVRVTSAEAKTYISPEPGIKPDMILFYNFEGTSNVILDDAVGDYQGEIKGAQRVNNQFGKAMLFNGTSDYVKLPNNLNLQTGSLEFWFKPEGGSRQTLFSASDGSANNLLQIDYESTNQNIFFTTINNTAINFTTILSASIVKLNQWNHFVYTFDGSQYIFYINGQKFYYIPGSASVLPFTNQSNKGFLADIAGKTDILIGATDNQGLKNFYKGSIDNFAIYNKVLTDDDVKRNYGLAKGQDLLLDFEGSGSEIKDNSANDFKNVTIADAAKNFRTDQGQYGKAITFNSDNHLNISDDPAFIFDKGMTVEGWFKVADLNPKLIYEANNISLGISSQCGGTNFCFRALIADEDNPANSGFKYAALPLSDINLNDWNYFAGVYDGGNIKIYLNGQKQEYAIKGSIYQNNNFKSACIGSCNNTFTGSLDEIAIYNQALSDGEIFSRVGAKNNSHLIVKTIGGEATSAQTFKYSDNVYPFLCSLVPNSGLQGTEVSLAGDNFGDSNKTVFQGIQYGVGSYTWFNDAVIDFSKINSWANILVKAINPFSDVGQPEIPVFVSIDPYSEPYNDSGDGNYTEGMDNFADINPNDGAYNPGTYQVEDFATGQTVPLDSLASSALPFYLSPVITSITPDNGPRGQWATINGYNFGDEPGEVYFYNEQLAELAPCSIQWTNTYIIAIVPPGAESGGVYIKTARGLDSNKVQFTVNNKPLAAGLCDVFTLYNTCDGGTKSGLACKTDANCSGGGLCTAKRSHNGQPGNQVFAEGDKFGDTQDLSNLIFTLNRPADITLWSNRNLEAEIPAGAMTGNVVVAKRIETGRTCIGFHIGSFCPSNQYESTYEDVLSNTIPLTISDLCQSGYLGQYTARDGNFPLETYSLDQQGQKVPYEQIALGVSASDGTYLYTTGSAHNGSTANQSLVGAEDSPRTIFKIGTGFNGTDLGLVYKKYQFDYTQVQPADLAINAYGYASSSPYSLIFTKDKKLYFGQVYHGYLFVGSTRKWSWWVPQIIFNDNNNTYTFHWQNIPQGLIYINSYDFDKLYADALPKTSLYQPVMASNGDNIFVMSRDTPGGFTVNPEPGLAWKDDNRNKGYTFQILDNNWNLLKEFSVLDIPENNNYRTQGYPLVAADENYLYIRYGGIMQVIDWHKEEFAGSWVYWPGLTEETSGTYDWFNQKYWIGAARDDVPTLDKYAPGVWARDILPVETSKHNRLYRYSRCPISGAGFCRTDEDCNACGLGTSSCVNGQCTPYIANFSPPSGAVGTWVTLNGCYFGCEPGQVYFSDSSVSLPPNAQVHYSFDVNANNDLGTGNDGNLKGNAVVSNSELVLDGNSSYDYVALNVSETAYTVSLWFKTTCTNCGIFSAVGAGNDFGSGGHDRHIYLSNGNICTRVWNNETKCTSGQNYADGNWHNVVHVFGGTSGGQKIYIDGQEKVAGVKANSDFTWQTGINIGYSQDRAANFFNGSIDEVSIFDRDLTLDEIDNLYNNGQGRTQYNSYGKQGLAINEPDCGTTWNCSEDYQAKLDQVIVEVPDKSSLPNMDCPTGNCPPAGYDPNDAIDGPIKLEATNGLADSTVDLSPSDFDVNGSYGPQICSLIPDKGSRGTTVKIVGENFGDTPGADDFVNFEPTAGLFAEPFTDANANGQYDAGEKYADINQNNQYDTDLIRPAYAFLIKQFINSTAKSDCPSGDGWDNKNICFNVPNDAAGTGTPLNTANDYVSVYKNLVSNSLNFSVDFNSCGNNILEYSQGEECDGTNLPALSCTDVEYPYDNICQAGANKGLECSIDTDCPDSTCIPACTLQCTNSCGLLVCDANGENCVPLNDLLCGNNQIDTTFDAEGNIVSSEECDGPDLGGATCSSQGFSSGNLACSNQCTFDTSQCSSEQILPETQVDATVPDHGEDAFCRNGIVDIYFDRLIDSSSLNVYDSPEDYIDANVNGKYDSGEIYTDANNNDQYDSGGNLVDKNIKISACSLTTFSQNEHHGIVSGAVQYFRNIFQKLLGYKREALAQTCTDLPIDQYELNVLNANDKTIITLVTDNLLDPEQFYRVTIVGGDNGIKNLAGGILDTTNSPVANAQDYIFEFKTLGTAGDVTSGICNVDWIDVLVSSQPYTDPNNRTAEFRSDDLFICAGKDNCQLDTDFDQDATTSGNQHRYKAIGKSATGFSLKARYQWIKTAALDPKGALVLYNKDEIGGDINADPDKVQNETGYTFVTANPLKEATAKLIVLAQAQGSYASPAQKDFLVYILLCENPWPSLTEKFPTSEIINAYNLQTYYCRDAGPPGPAGDLPAAKMLFPEVTNLNTLRNANFELGDLTNWNAVTGTAFDFQPVYSDITLLRDGISSQIQGNWWLSTKEKYRANSWEDIMVDPQREYATGILRSQAFLVEGDQLKFRIGGSNNPWPVTTITGIVDLTDSDITDVTSVVFASRTNPNEDFVIRAQFTGNNLTTMREVSLDISQYQGQTGIIYIYDNNANGYINFDDLRQFKQGVQIPIRF